MSVRALPNGSAGLGLAALERHAVDPRARILGTAGFAVAVASLEGFVPVLAALAAAILAALASGLAWRTLARRLLMLEGFMVVLLVMLPFTVPGRPLLGIGPLTVGLDGLLLAAVIALKANAVVIAILSQLGTLEPARLGHGLARLGAPRKLVALLLLTARYVAVFEDEYRRLRRAMRARGFRATSSRHTWRSLGWLVGMLLVRSNDRGHRVLQAMKCRGFTGRFPVMGDLRFGLVDALYLGLAVVLAVALVAGDRL